MLRTFALLFNTVGASCTRIIFCAGRSWASEPHFNQNHSLKCSFQFRFINKIFWPGESIGASCENYEMFCCAGRSCALQFNHNNRGSECLAFSFWGSVLSVYEAPQFNQNNSFEGFSQFGLSSKVFCPAESIDANYQTCEMDVRSWGREVASCDASGFNQNYSFWASGVAPHLNQNNSLICSSQFRFFSKIFWPGESENYKMLCCAGKSCGSEVTKVSETLAA